jgi:hypothetical protein
MTTYALTGRRRYREGLLGSLTLQVEETIKRTDAGAGITTTVEWRDARPRDLTPEERRMMA